MFRFPGLAASFPGLAFQVNELYRAMGPFMCDFYDGASLDSEASSNPHPPPPHTHMAENRISTVSSLLSFRMGRSVFFLYRPFAFV